MARSHAAPVNRRAFSRLENPLEVPHLIDIQRLSFEHLTDPKGGLLRETIDDISPIEDYTGNLAIVFGDFKFDEPTHSVAECRRDNSTDFFRRLLPGSPCRFVKANRSNQRT